MKNLFMNKKTIIISIAIVIVLGLTIGFFFLQNKDDKKEVKEIVDTPTIEEQEEKKEVQVVDLYSTTRPIAVMINNLNEARPYQSGLQDAYIVYEAIVEGGITRFMAVFKDINIDRIGTVRSSRPYYLDYVLENDAIYIHFGFSVQAKLDIASLGINNVNFLYDAGYWRENLPVATEHTAFTSMDNINQAIAKKGYRTTTSQKTLLNYQVDEVDLSNLEGAVVANNVAIPYSTYMTSSYTYDSVNKVYLRFANGASHIDYINKKQYTAKNIIIINVANHTLTGAYQALDNIGNGTGYYITNGYAIPITYEKSSRSSQTIYRKLDGNEIEVNDGNTFVQIQPTSQTTKLS